MGTIEKTPLEKAVLVRFHQLYQAQGFPPSETIGVLRRENIGGGRYVDLECEMLLDLKDGYVDLCGSHIEMRGLPNGLMAVVLVKGKKVRELEFAVYGGDFWNGEECDWFIT